MNNILVQDKDAQYGDIIALLESEDLSANDIEYLFNQVKEQNWGAWTWEDIVEKLMVHDIRVTELDGVIWI